MAKAATRSTVTDDRLEALEDFRAELKPRLAANLSISRDNPGRTPPAWSVRDFAGRPILTFGLIDRTFFWTWDGGDSNHYTKSREMMAAVITGELARFGHLA